MNIEIATIENWLSKIPKSEKDVPYFVVNGALLTPSETIKVLAKDASIPIESPVDIDGLVVEQFKARLENMPDEARKIKFISGNRIHTVEEMYNEVFNGTDYGITIAESYKNVYNDIMSRLGS